MSLSKEAIEHIQQNDSVQKVIEQLQLPGSQEGYIAVPSSVELEDLEMLMPTRRRYRAGFSTETIKDFVKYIERHNVIEDVVLECTIDKDRMTSKIVFDAGNEQVPLHANHRADLRLKMTANFKKLMQVNGDQMDQKELAEFFEDYSENIQVFDTSGDLMTAVQAAAAVRKLSVEQIRAVNSEVQDFGRTLSATEQIEMKAQGRMPAVVKFTCEPYHGLSERSIELRVSSNTSRETPTLALKIKKLEELQEALADELVSILEEKIQSENISMYLGSITY